MSKTQKLALVVMALGACAFLAYLFFPVASFSFNASREVDVTGRSLLFNRDANISSVRIFESTANAAWLGIVALLLASACGLVCFLRP